MKKNYPIILYLIPVFFIYSCQKDLKQTSNSPKSNLDNQEIQNTEVPDYQTPVDSTAYFSKLKEISNGDTTGRWPVKNQPLPLPGAILPQNRIVAYYGNLYSSRMGILGELPPKQLWGRLHAEVRSWEKADSLTPVVPAIHYIAVVAQGSPLKDGKYRTRMPESQIDSVLAIAKMHNAIVFLDIQVALSRLQDEIPLLEKYLKLSHVHLGIDPEFSMKDGSKPGTKIGTFDAADINYSIKFLQKLVKDNQLTPKVLVVHRFTRGMITNYKNIQLCPEVQVVINMDGWGAPYLKRNTYLQYIYREPVQFTGYKLFYKNDIKNPPHQMQTPADLMKLTPRPVYIQYQ